MATGENTKKTEAQPLDKASQGMSKSEQEKIDKAAMDMAKKADRDTIRDEESNPEDQPFTNI